MNDINLKRIADTLEEILRMIKEDQAQTKKRIENEKKIIQNLKMSSHIVDVVENTLKGTVDHQATKDIVLIVHNRTTPPSS